MENVSKTGPTCSSAVVASNISAGDGVQQRNGNNRVVVCALPQLADRRVVKKVNPLHYRANTVPRSHHGNFSFSDIRVGQRDTNGIEVLRVAWGHDARHGYN